VLHVEIVPGIVGEEYLTLAQAAERAGYSSASTLYAAAKKGHLQTLMGAGRPPYLTTPKWLDEYLANLKINTQFRGRPKAPSDGDSDDS